jgi:regulatory protein YycI of two-component signal transduction system YycFG
MNKRIIIFLFLILILFLVYIFLDNSIERDKKELYITQNISQITDEEEVLGGHFFVTHIEWIDNNTAIIDFEDGHNAFTIDYSFSIIDKVKSLFYDF